MRILYFIGNGFDVNLDLKTKYSEFYENYIKVKSKSDLVDNLKENIKDYLKKHSSPDSINWSDLEIALGEYTENLKSVDEFNEVYNDLEDRLAEYLEEQVKNYDFSKLNYKKFISDLVRPEINLEPTDKQKIILVRHKSTPKSINIISLNYTKSIEKIINDDLDKTNKDIQNVNRLASLEKIIHLHGDTQNNMVLGVNNLLQIFNKNFRTDLSITDTLIKNNCYLALKQNLDQICAKLITESNLICIFGSSIGKTDKFWWGLIGNHIKNNKPLIIFVKKDKVHNRRRQQITDIERAEIKKFLSETNLNKDEQAMAGRNIIVAVNTNMFKLKQ